jgi:dTDP-4-amino-4,6-dideoxygalactose transaminase
MACLASTQPYATAGLKIVWADIDPHIGTLDPVSVEKHISKKTKAIIHNHFCGYPGYIDEINKIGKKYGIKVIDDGIECFGTLYNDKLIGNCGSDITVFSFNPVRILNTIDGGAVLIKDRDIRQKAKLIRDCGIDRSMFRDELGEINPNCDITLQGYSATMSNVNAYIGVEQFKTLKGRIDKQRKNAKKWDDYFSEKKEFTTLSVTNGTPNYWVYGVLAKDKRKEIEGFRNKGVYASSVHINNNIYSIFGKEETMKGVGDFYKSFIAVPCGWWIEDEIWNRNY